MHKKYTDQELILVVQLCKSKGQICKALGIPANGKYFTLLQSDIDRLQLNTEHFIRVGGYLTRKYEVVKKVCPICGDIFTTTLGSPKEQTTCSVGCANSYFRTGKNNPRYKDIEDRAVEAQYRLICFQHYERKCVICGWDYCIDVHHIDGNHNNNEPINLIPLCPNHHTLTRMLKYRDEINDSIKQIVSLKFDI